jgi:hypothetical protein
MKYKCFLAGYQKPAKLIKKKKKKKIYIQGFLKIECEAG